MYENSLWVQGGKSLVYFSFGSVCIGRVTAPSVMPYWLPSLAEHITVNMTFPEWEKSQSGV